MAEVMQEVGGDGFVFTGPLTRRYVAEVTDGVVPARFRQRRGLVRSALRPRTGTSATICAFDGRVVCSLLREEGTGRRCR